MESDKQVFYTRKKTRWKSFLWTFRIVLFSIFFLLAVTIYALMDASDVLLPKLSSKQELKADTLLLSSSEKDFEKVRQKLFRHISKLHFKNNSDSILLPHGIVLGRSNIRAAFYVNWSQNSYQSLKRHTSQLNMVFPEWFFLDAKHQTIQTNVDTAALRIMRLNKIAVVPMLSNFLNDQWEQKNTIAMLRSPKQRANIIQQCFAMVERYKLQGINIDFEDLPIKDDELLIQFQKELFEVFHPKGYLVTIDVVPNNEDYNLAALSNWSDYIVLMAYDQHNLSSAPGSISDIKWVEEVLDKSLESISPEKIILGIGAFGYDWVANGDAQSLTFQDAMRLANLSSSTIEFDNNSYALAFAYQAEGKKHQVFFNDACTIFNIMRTGAEAHLAGTSFWYLGSEDERIWSFYRLPLKKEENKLASFSPKWFTQFSKHNDFTFVGDGEFLLPVENEFSGKVAIEFDTADQLIAEENYVQLPTKVTIEKFGESLPKTLALTFDDGPDKTYTPQIIEILKKEKVPGAFFVVGENAEANIGLLKQLSKEGFEIGNHTFTHPNLGEVGEWRASLEINACRRLIEAVTGRSTVLFRPPYNADAAPENIEEVVPIIEAKNQQHITVGETIDPRDWEKDITPEKILERIKQQQNLGSIVLLHDGGGNREATVKALPQIISYFKSQGYTFVSLSQMLGKSPQELMPSISHKDKLLGESNFFLAEGFSSFLHFLSTIFILSIFFAIGRTLLIALLAFIQKRKKNARKIVAPSSFKPKVSIIIPAYNEEVNIAHSLQNLLRCDYENTEFVFVDDGSKDNTLQIVQHHFGNLPQLKIYSKKNGGKAAALNFGIEHSQGEILVCIDADTQLLPNAVSKLVPYFYDTTIGAVAGNVKVGNKVNMLTKWQSIEYVTSQNFDRRAYDLLNCITVVPGALGAFRREAILNAGAFATDTLAEDCDLTIRIIKNGYTVRYEEDAVAFTEVPEKNTQFLKQRLRWSYGTLQSVWKHKSMFLNPHFKAMGMFALPSILVFQALLPIFTPLADIGLLLGIFTGNALKVIAYFLLFTLVDAAAAWLAFSFEKEDKKVLWYILPQRIIYRYLLFAVLLKTMLNIIKGELQNWGVLKRTGNVKLQQA
jgi:cellulose synthase/poly-beta-1,6-N-acetylglucosamine synthase-like glycosyltransferase/spore germination protein YaaH/peptidoglycan/xylan/chitin deacetylase (PgdA/CDA1 family)